jgi:YVTN family beta-propeller protein
VLGAAIAAAGISLAGAVGEAPGRGPGLPPRQALLVANLYDGTVDVIEQRTFERIERIDVAPDYRACVAAAGAPASGDCVVENELSARGEVLLLDDVTPSRDGRTIYVSRPSLGDVAAIDLRTERLMWRAEVPGDFPDHLALSPDGRRLLVSAKSQTTVEVISTRSARIVDRFPTGVRPHGNQFSADGELAYNGSIGRGIADPEQCRCWLTVVDGRTFEVRRVAEFDQGVRPFAITANDRRAYIQLSLLHGFIEYDLRHERRLRTLRLPVPDGSTAVDPGSPPGASVHHGLSLSPDESKICAAASVSDYVAVVRRRSLSLKRAIPVGDDPYWTISSPDGRYCFVANRGSDDVSVISYRRAKEVARIPVGDHPQRIRTARLRLARRTGDPRL